MRKKKRKHYHSGNYTSLKTGQIYAYRSSWELSFMKYLDDDSDVATYDYEGVVVPYISNVASGKVRKYFPDFFIQYVDGTKKLIEIKPAKRVKQVTVQKKLKAAEKWCEENGATLAVITEVELKELGLL